MMCANRAFLRTPEVELHGEHRFSPTPDLKSTGDKGVRGKTLCLG